ncbi:MAG: WD40 repeat domain-containing serine/threonine-protein kinase, partial [Planctomycetota bacterium]
MDLIHVGQLISCSYVKNQLFVTGFLMSDTGNISIEEVADSFATRLENGEKPSIEEYKRKYPQLADRIEAIFPALVMLEEADDQGGARQLAVDDSIPRELGDYQLIQEIGRGGMGIVFEALHSTMRRRVALKVLPRSSAEKSNYLSRFLTEARSAGQLHHTNIVPVFEVGEADGLHFYAMQFIRGENLDKVIEDIKVIRGVEDQKQQSGAKRLTAYPDDRDLDVAGLSRSLASEMVRGGDFDHSPGEDVSTVIRDQENASVAANGSISASVQIPRAQNAGANVSGAQIASERNAITPHDDEHNDEPDATLANRLTASKNKARPVPRTPNPTIALKSTVTPKSTAARSTQDGDNRTETILSSPNSSTIAGGKENYHRRVASIGAQVADALDYAHKHGVLHRDVKPANLILDTEGNVWVTDFGLAKMEMDDLTQTGDIIGTLRYMAPERFAGEADARSDIYSLGLTLYELCTLQCAFDSNRGTLIQDVTSSVVTSPRRIDETIPQDLETIILKCVEPQLERRYASAMDLAEDLSRFLADRPIKARRASLLERGWRVCRRNPLAASMAACIALLMTTVAAVVVGSLIRFADLKADQAATEIQMREESQIKLFYSRLDQARMRRYSGLLGQRYEAMSAIREATELLPGLNESYLDETKEELIFRLRNEAIAAMSLTDMESTWHYQSENGWAERGRFTYSPDYELFAEGHHDGRIRIGRVDDAGPYLTLPAPIEDTPSWLTNFTADNRFLASQYLKPNAGISQQHIYIWDLENPAQPFMHFERTNRFAFSKRGDRLAVLDRDLIDIYSLPDGEKLTTIDPLFNLEDPDSRPFKMQFSNDSAQLAITQRGKEYVEFWQISPSPRFIHKLEIDQAVYTIDWDSDRMIFVIGGQEGDLFYWRGDLDAEPVRIELHQNTVIKAYIHPAKEIIATEAWDSTVRLTDMLSGEQVLLIHDYSLLSQTFGKDGQLGYQENGYEANGNLAAGIWRVSDPLIEVYSHTSGNGWVTKVHPEFCEIVACNSGDTLELRDISAKKILHVVEDINVSRIRFNSSGQIMYVGGKDGLFKFELDISKDSSGVMVNLSEPELLYEQQTGDFVISPDETRISLKAGSRVRTISAVDGSQISDTGPHRNLTRIEITADGRKLITGTWHGYGIRIWNAESGEL